MFFAHLRMVNVRFRTHCCVYEKGSSMPKRRSRSLACKGRPLCANKLQKNCMCCGLPKPNCQTACFSYIFSGWCYLYMAKSYIAIYQKARRTENLTNNSGTIKALSWNHSRQSTVEGPLSKEGHSSEAASLLVYIYIYM